MDVVTEMSLLHLLHLLEESAKGPSAKDVWKKDPKRVTYIYMSEMESSEKTA